MASATVPSARKPLASADRGTPRRAAQLTQPRLPDLLFRRVMRVLVIAIGIRYLSV
jgi:hypothetical protein